MRHALILLGLTALLFGACGGESFQENVAEFSSTPIDVSPTRTFLLDDDNDVVRRIDLDDTRVVVQEVEHDDLKTHPLYADEICGGKGCQIADEPCGVWETPGGLLCACEHEGYLFICR